MYLQWPGTFRSRKLQIPIKEFRHEIFINPVCSVFSFSMWRRWRWRKQHAASSSDSNTLQTPETIENTRAIDPLPSFKAVQLPTSSAFDYRKQADGIHLELNPYLNPNADLPDDLIPMTHRAFKVWSRRIDSLITQDSAHRSATHREPGEDGKAVVDFVAGYTITTGCNVACANHHGDPQFPPAGRSGNTPVVVTAQDYFNNRHYFTEDDGMTVDGFKVLAHEFGHIFNYTAPDGHYHADCDGEGIMCDRGPFSEMLIPVGPAEQDFDGITHHYSLKEPSDHEVFGIWASVRNQNSSLNEFGIRVTRTLTTDQVQATVSDRRQPIDNVLEDHIRIETMIDGTDSTDITYPANTGTVTWNGDLIAVNTQRFTPVLGDAILTMDLSNTDLLQARFALSGTIYNDDGSVGEAESVPFGYTLTRTGNVWLDEQGRVDARFYAIGNDDTAAAAGRLDDESIHLMGVYGVIRDDVMVPPPPVGPEG